MKCCGHKPYKSKKVKKEHREEVNANEETEELKKAPYPIVIHRYNILQSIFPSVEVYIIYHQSDKLNGIYVDKYHNSSNFKRAISEYKVVLHCEKYE